MPKPTIYTVGHSDLSLVEFEKELEANHVTMIADVRSLTGSDAFAQFDEDRLKPALAKVGIKYVVIPKLGGRRPRDYAIDPHTNGFWINTSFRNYADYATTPAFAQGLAQLKRLAAHNTVAYMCSEAVWWRCHRRIISDHLLAQGWDVQHIMSATETDKATYNPGAVAKAGNVTYPGDQWAKAHPRAAAESRSKRGNIAPANASIHSSSEQRNGKEISHHRD